MMIESIIDVMVEGGDARCEDATCIKMVKNGENE